MASISIDVPTKKPTLNPIVRRSFIEQYVKDVQEWKTCAKLIRVMTLSRASLFSIRNFMYKCWLEDTSLDNAFHLRLNNGKGLSLMVPDQIVFEIFRLVRPEKIRLCGHFHCDQQRLELLMESVDKGVTGLELYRLTSEENAIWFLKRCARQLKYLACEVAYLEDYLRAPIKLDKFLAYHRHTVDSALTWIFKAIDTVELDLGIKPFIEFSPNFDGPVRERLKVLRLIGVVSRRDEIFEFLSAFKSKAPNLSKFEMHFYCRQSENEWQTFLSDFIEFGNRLKTCVQSVKLKISISAHDDISPILTTFYGHAVKTEQSVDEFGQIDTKMVLIGTSINLIFVARETLDFHYEDM